MSGFHPVTEPLEGGLLEVGDGQKIYWEVSGNPAGQPALLLHGGPGSGSSPSTRRHFDPQRYRIVSFDQRGCGRSLPHASGEGVDFSVNTTGHLLFDPDPVVRAKAARDFHDWDTAAVSNRSQCRAPGALV